MIVLGVAGCIVVIGATIFIQDRYRNPQPILDEARQFDVEADKKGTSSPAAPQLGRCRVMFFPEST